MSSPLVAEGAVIVTFDGPPQCAPAPVSHRQVGVVFAAALALVDQARINPSARSFFSTIVPASLAGLVAGPFAALIGASSLDHARTFQGDQAFLAACTMQRPARFLVAPAEIASAAAGRGPRRVAKRR